MKPKIQYPDFQKIEIRVGEVKDASVPEGSKKLIELSVDLGEEYGIVTVFTGLLEYFKPEDFIGKKFQFVCNLEPRPMMGKHSQGMIMAADGETQPTLIEVSKEIKNGTIVR